MDPHGISRRSAIVAAIAGMAAPALAQESASVISTRPLKITLGFAAGTALDLVVRTIAPKLEPLWPAGVVTDNRPGAGGSLGVTAVLAAPADGTSILYATASETLILPAFQAKPTFDSTRLVPICQVTTGSIELVCGAQKSYKTFPDMVRETKGKDTLFVGTFGAGTSHHLLSLILASVLKRPVEPVHYRSPGDMLTDVASGQLDAAFVSPVVALGWVQAGKARVLGTSAPERNAMWPSVPTFAEIGLKAAESTFWGGFFAPPGASAPLVERLSKALLAAAGDPSFKERMERAGLLMALADTASFARTYAADRERYKAAVVNSGVPLL